MTWFAVTTSLTYFLVVSWTFLPSRDTAFWAVLFIGCWVLGIFLFGIATLTEHRLPTSVSPDHCRHCDFCAQDVPALAKHCRRCNRCRCGFDHHCRFINNCVTASNYRAFFYGCLFLISAWYVAIAHLFRSVPAALDNFDSVIDRMTKRFGTQTSKATFWVLFAFGLVINLAIGVPMTVLAIYHTVFQRIEVSTLDYLLDRFPNTHKEIQRFCCTCGHSGRVGAL
jgi:hypothetical protein